jgi:hypothetical protein
MVPEVMRTQSELWLHDWSKVDALMLTHVSVLEPDALVVVPEPEGTPDDPLEDPPDPPPDDPLDPLEEPPEEPPMSAVLPPHAPTREPTTAAARTTREIR